MPPSPTQVYVGTGSSVKRPHRQFKADDVQERSQFKFQNLEAEQVTELQSEIAALKRELLELKQEKADLEILLEATAEHSDSVEAELHNTAIAALKQSEEMFRTIAEATPVPVLISRVGDGTVLYANMAASTTFGIPSEDFLNHSTLEFYHDPSDRQRLLDALECDGCVESFELQCKRADGSLFWVAASLRRLGFPLGLEADIADFIAHTQINLNPGDGIVLYTDGITEARNLQKDCYALERLCETVQRYWHLSAKEVQHAVIQDVQQFIGEQDVNDDLTLLVLKQK